MSQWDEPHSILLLNKMVMLLPVTKEPVNVWNVPNRYFGNQTNLKSLQFNCLAPIYTDFSPYIDDVGQMQFSLVFQAAKLVFWCVKVFFAPVPACSKMLLSSNSE